MSEKNESLFLHPSDTFVRRHIAPNASDVETMLKAIDSESLDALIDEAIPADIRLQAPLRLSYSDAGRPLGERELVASLKELAEQNQVKRSLIGLGYYDCIVPPVIQRNILENPGWYTQYTPYQAEISQGRLEALINFQTMVGDLTALPLANASLLDEATAAAEAMHMAYAVGRGKRSVFFASERCFPQTLAVLRTRAEAIGIELRIGDEKSTDFSTGEYFAALLQYPDVDGAIHDYGELVEQIHAGGALAVVAADLLSLALLRAPGEFGADICVGSSQRFGVPMGFGGPHAGFLATSEKYRRNMPGRIIGVSRDAKGKHAYRMAMQTREQHIRREKATSNICTAQVLLAIMAGMYGVYHGPEGLKAIAGRVHGLTKVLARGLERLGCELHADTYFDTIAVKADEKRTSELMARALDHGINLRRLADGGDGSARGVALSLDEKSSLDEVAILLEIFGEGTDTSIELSALTTDATPAFGELERRSEFMTHPVFHQYRAEHEMLRYIHRLQGRDLSLTTSMISLGSCTMKLNATSEMLPITWPEFADLHPFAPSEQTEGYQALFTTLETWLSEITGFSAVSLQPNAGSQGEFTGLLLIRAYHRDRGEAQRNICLIPVSAHGTNPASAVMAGMKVVPVACDEAGNIDIEDLRAKADKHADALAALMVTYPSTHGVFEAGIREICDIVHERGGQVYLDGANMNAQVGLCRPGDYGADVCHLNLHKTFCIPHGGGGPGVGPVGVAEHLEPYLPSHPVIPTGGERAIGPVAAATWGSPAILPIPWVYIALMGAEGLTQATRVAILNANYMAKRLGEHYPVLFTGEKGRVAHEFILDLRPFKASAGIEAEDVAKRLMDYGFHAPTMSFPVAGTLMIEPTESESLSELDRFCDAMIAIREEIQAIENGKWSQEDNPLKFAPHTAEVVTASEWGHGYTREEAAYPRPWLRENKFWPSVSRVDNAWGDRHLHCSCIPMSDYEEE